MNELITIPSKRNNPTGCLILLHGSGDSGPGISETIKVFLGSDAQLPHIKIIFPTAPLLPFRAYGGMVVNTWYDISDFTDDAIENSAHIEKSAEIISKIVMNEVSLGIPRERIAIAGFSRGGAMSYYIGYYYIKGLAGVGVMSSWLPKSSNLYKEIKLRNGVQNLPPLFQTHGDSDFVISKYLAENTVSRLKSAGIKTRFQTYRSLGHELRPEILKDLYSFILEVIPSL